MVLGMIVVVVTRVSLIVCAIAMVVVGVVVAVVVVIAVVVVGTNLGRHIEYYYWFSLVAQYCFCLKTFICPVVIKLVCV